MVINQWIALLIEFLGGLAVVIPLIDKLIKTVKEVAAEKNWNKIVKALLDMMVVAQDKFERGADRKEWVMSGIKETATILDYNYDEIAEKKVSDMIDAICLASKKIGE